MFISVHFNRMYYYSIYYVQYTEMLVFTQLSFFTVKVLLNVRVHVCDSLEYVLVVTCIGLLLLYVYLYIS